MKSTLTPPIRCGDEREEIERTYTTRLCDLFNGEANVEAADRDWNNQHRPPVHRFKTFCTIAFIEATADLLPSERKIVSFIHRYNL